VLFPGLGSCGLLLIFSILDIVPLVFDLFFLLDVCCEFILSCIVSHRLIACNVAGWS
jgi:hypothetical protein